MAIYYLDADDEITSAAARIRDSSDPRIALVLSGGSRVATSRINFRLLAGEAKHRNKRLAIIAADPTVQSVARSAQLPVYASVGDYETAEAALAGAVQGGASHAGTAAALDELALTVGPGGVPVRSAKTGATRFHGPSSVPATKSALRVPPVLLAVIAAVVIVVIAGAGLIFYPSANVILTLRQDPVGPMTISVKVDPAAAAANDQAGVVPGVSKAFSVQASGTYDATGVNVVETAAKGTVTFFSLDTVGAVSVVAGTRVATGDGVAFATLSTVKVPMASVSTDFRITPGKVDVTVQAVTKGVSGNVPAGAIVTVPSGLVAVKVSVTNTVPTTGGTHTETPQVQKSDVEGAQADLWAKLQADFQTALTSPGAVPSGSTLFTGSAHLGVATCSPDPQTVTGQVVGSFQIECQDTGTVIVANMANVKDLATRRMRAAVKTGYSLVASSVATKLGVPEAQGSIMIVPVSVQAIQVPVVDVNKLKSAIEGKSVAEARTILAQYGKVEITLSPGWASTVPTFDFRVSIQVVVPSAKSSGSPPAGGGVSPSAARANNPGGVATPAVSTASPPIQLATPAASPTTALTASPSAIPTPKPTPSTLPTAPPTAGISPSQTP